MADTTTTVSGKGEEDYIPDYLYHRGNRGCRFVVAGLQEVYPHGRCESRFVPGECFGSGGGTSDPFVRDGGGYSETG